MPEYGAYALQSLDNLLQQRMIDKLTAEKVAEQIRQFNVGAEERKRTHNLEAQRHAATLAEQTRQHEGQRAERIANTAYPEDIATPEAQALLQKTGFGGALRTVTQDPFEGVDPSSMGELPMVSGRLRGGANYLTQQNIATQRAQAAAQAEAGKAERATTAAVAAASQHDIANAMRQQGLNIQAQLAGSTIEGRTQKAAETKRSDEAKRLGATDEAQRVINLANEFEQTPGAEGIFGVRGVFPNIPGGKAANAQALLEQLKSSLAIGKIQEMKAQSRTGATGFGQLSERELKVLEDAAGRLQRTQSLDAARKELTVIRQHMQTVIDRNHPEGVAATTPTTSSRPRSAAEWLKANGL